MTSEPGRVIITITPAMIEQLINDGSINIERLTGNAIVERFWIRHDTAPGGDICFVVVGEGLNTQHGSALLPFVRATINQP